MKKMVVRILCLATGAGLWLNASALTPAKNYYVTDGLVACWDGIDNTGTGEHNASATAWVDSVAGYTFNLSGVTVLDNGFGFDGSSSYGKMTENVSSAFPSGVKTVEIVIKLDSTSVNGIALHGPTASCISFGPYGNYILLSNKDRTNGYAEPSDDVTNCYATVYGSDNKPSKYNRNGASVTSVLANNYWGSPDANTAWLGRRSDGYYFKGKIFAIRVYSCELKEDQIAANFRADARRFMGVVPNLVCDPIPDQDFTGSEICPTPKVFFSQGGDRFEQLTSSDFSCSYANNVDPGTATVTVTGLGKYEGLSSTTTFRIVGIAVFYANVSSASPESPYDAPEKAAKTIAAALQAAKDKIAADGVHAIVHVAAGTYNETGLTLDAPVVIEGASRDGVIIVDDVVGQRAFTLSHADAAVLNLTISGQGLRTAGGSGGHINMSAGLVENCVIKDGRSSPTSSYGNGGNVYMSGGRLSRCLITGGMCNWGGWYPSATSNGMALYITKGIVDSCFFKDNKVNDNNSRSYYGIYVNGAATILNCTVTGGDSFREKEGVGIYVNSSSAVIANSVFYGNGDNSAKSNFGTKNLSRFFNCASAVAGSSGTGWQVVTDDDFVNTRTGSDLHPVVTSKLVDTGDTTKRSEGCATLDLDGNDRVSGTAVDIGCWELDQSAFNCGGYVARYEALVGSGVEFIAKVVGPATSPLLEWDFGNGVTETTTDLIHTYAYPAGGLFTVKLRASPDGGTTWTDWKDVASNIAVAPSEIWVEETSEKPTFPYSTRETAARNLDVVFAMLTNSISGGKPCVNGVKVRVCPGTYQASGMYLPVAMSVVGETDDPADVNIVDDVVGKRAFTLSHADAVVKNLTISGNGIRTNGSSGGHVNMSAGLVENCVIKDGYASASKGNGTGGNIAMSGGKLVRCLVTGGKSNWGGWFNANNYGMAIYATGGTIDSCFFKDNKVDDNDSNAKYGVYLNGAVKLINCTVTGGSSFREKTGVGVYVDNGSATVVNCVIYGNGDNSAAQNFGDKNLGRFFYCASSVAGSSGTEWKVLTNEDFADFAGGDLRPKSGSQLVDHGTSDTQYRPEDCTTLDLDGNDRISGKEIDIGCWELDQSQLTVSGYLDYYGLLEASNATFHAFAVGTATDLVFRWDFGNGKQADTRNDDYAYAYPTSGLFTVKLAASPDGGTTWTDWYVFPRTVVVAPAVMFVDPACETPTYPYKTPATAATTLTAALVALTNNLSENATSVDGVEVRIAKGSTLSETGMKLASAVAVVGETEDPNDVEIVDQVSGKRAFTLSHEGARVANLKVSGSGMSTIQSSGGHVWMSAGVVENCIVAGGKIGRCGADGDSFGGNVSMSGGRMVRCQVLNGQIGYDGHYFRVSKGAGIYANGGIIDTCLVKGNAAMYNSRCGGIYLEETATAVNCTVIGNTPGAYDDKVTAGVYAGSGSATIANSVFYGNGDNSGAANFGNANLDRFQYCASSVTNESCATWRVMDATAFKNYAKYLEEGEPKYLSPVGGGALQNGGCTAADYLNMGGSAEKDLLGRVRISGKYLDIGCIEKPTLGLMLMVR